MTTDPKIISSFSVKDKLNGIIWENNQIPKDAIIKPEIRKKLLEIAYEFMDFIDIDFFVDDIIFTGSLSNFNWSEFSDIDLHLEVDFTQFEPDSVELYRELFNLKKLLFNTNHNIKIKGFEVELYVQDIIEPHTSGGIYSILFDKWLIVPKRGHPMFDKTLLKQKIKTWVKKIGHIVSQSENIDYDETISLIKEIRDKIKKYRKIGLERNGELSYENLVFKYLRRSGELGKLLDLTTTIKDKKLSIESINESTLIGGNFKWGADPSAHGKRSFGNWQSDNAYDLMAPVGTSVYSLSDGKITKTHFTEGGESGKNSKIYGWQLTIEDSDNKFFYTHLGTLGPSITNGAEVKKGQLLGTIGKPKSGRSWYPHVHIGVERGDLKNYLSSDGNTIKDTRAGSITELLLSLFGLTKPTGEETKFIKEIENLIKSNQKLSLTKTKPTYNSDVATLQSVLQILGYSLPKWGIDGKFGPETQKAVVNFQKENQLQASGIVDEQTLKKLLSHLSNTKIGEKIDKIEKKSSVVGSTNEKKTLNFLISKGLTVAQASGIAGNIKAESGFKPDINGDSETSFGIAQWHNTRKDGLFKWAEANQLDPKVLDTQLEYLWYELSTKYSNTLRSIKQAKTAKEAAEIFASEYERPQSTDYSNRVSYSEEIYNNSLIS